jgi:hypothetical protein
MSAATLTASTRPTSVAVAVLRPNWRRSSSRLTVVYPGTSCRVALTCGKDLLFSGQWLPEVRFEGAWAAPISDWVELRRISDDDVDYLELGIDFGAGLRVRRHLLLARDDRFLLLADTLLAPSRATLEYRGTLQLAPDIAFRESCETRDGLLIGRKPRACVLPLALPEWLADRSRGELTRRGAGLQLRQTGVGQALFAPLFLDLDRRRIGRPLTWRQLTVAESHRVQPAEAAVGFRVAIGRRQWLIYRSLTRPRNRSLLGHNLQSEIFVARFDRTGEVKPLVEVT